MVMALVRRLLLPSNQATGADQILLPANQKQRGTMIVGHSGNFQSLYAKTMYFKESAKFTNNKNLSQLVSLSRHTFKFVEFLLRRLVSKKIEKNCRKKYLWEKTKSNQQLLIFEK